MPSSYEDGGVVKAKLMQTTQNDHDTGSSQVMQAKRCACHIHGVYLHPRRAPANETQMTVGMERKAMRSIARSEAIKLTLPQAACGSSEICDSLPAYTTKQW